MSAGSSNARAVMNSDTVKPIPPSAAAPSSCRPVTSSGRSAQPEPYGAPRRDRDADRLAHHEADHDTDGQRRGGGGAEAVGGELDAGIGQREHRDDEQARPAMQLVLQPLQL